MTFKVSRITGKLYIMETLEEVPFDTNNANYLLFVAQYTGEIEYFEGTEEEIAQQEIDQEVLVTTARQCDGVAFFNKFSAKLNVKQRRGEITQGNRNIIDKRLELVKNAILSGYFKTALIEMDALSTGSVNQIGLDIYNDLKAQIMLYISLNYEDTNVNRR